MWCVEWILVGFYGPSHAAKKKKAWESLSTLLKSFNLPWVCLGNFNFTIRDDEKFGGKKRRFVTCKLSARINV